jgi:hypothetical protein
MWFPSVSDNVVLPSTWFLPVGDAGGAVCFDAGCAVSARTVRSAGRLPVLREMDPEDAAEYRKSAAKAGNGADGEVPGDYDIAAKQDLE